MVVLRRLFLTLLLVFIAVPGLAATLYIPHITGGDANWKDVLEVDNTGSAAANYALTLYNAAGAKIYGPVSFSINGGAYGTKELKTLAANAAAGMVSYSDLGLKFRIAYENLSGGGVAEFDLIGSTFPELYFFFANFADEPAGFVSWKGIALMNAGSEPAKVTITAYGNNQVRGTTSVNLSPNVRMAALHSSLFPQLFPWDVERIAVSATGGKLVGIAITGDSANGRLLFTKAAPAPPSSGEIVIPHITGGDDNWRDVLQIDNVGETAGEMTIRLYDATGKLIRLLSSVQVYALDYSSINLKGLESSATSGKISYTGDLNFRLAYENESGGAVAEFNLSQATQSTLQFLFANFTSLVQWKGVAVANGGTQDVQVSITCQTGGQTYGPITKTIPDKARIMGLHNKWFSQVSTGDVVRLRVSAPSPVLSGITISGNWPGDKMLSTPGLPHTSGDDGSGAGGGGGGGGTGGGGGGGGDGGGSGDTPFEVDDNESAVKALIAMGNAQAGLYADLLNMFSEDGSKPPFDPTLKFKDQYYSNMADSIAEVLKYKSVYDQGIAWLDSASAKTPSVKYRNYLQTRGVLSSIKNFFWGWAWGSAQKAANRVNQNFGSLPPHVQQQLLAEAQQKFGSKVGSSPAELQQKLKNGDLTAEAHQMHDLFYHSFAGLDGGKSYMDAAQDNKGRPIDIAYEEGSEGVKKGVDVVESAGTAIVGSKFSGFSDGYDKAKDTITKINKTMEGDFQGLASDAAKNLVKNNASDFLKDKLGLGDGAAGEFADLIADKVEETAKNTMAANKNDKGDKVDDVEEWDWSFLSPAFPTGLDPSKITSILGIPDSIDIPLIIGLLTGDGGQDVLPLPPGDYDVTVVGKDDTADVPDVKAPEGQGTVVPVDDGTGDGGDGGGEPTYSLSASASPANPGPGQGVTVTGRVSPAQAGLTITFSISGTDGYGKTETHTTSAAGTASFYIPGGAEGVVDTVTVTLKETGQKITFSYVF